MHVDGLLSRSRGHGGLWVVLLGDGHPVGVCLVRADRSVGTDGDLTGLVHG